MRNIESIIKELEGIQTVKDKIKAYTMIYQYDLKIEVGKAYGLTLDKVDLPFNQWIEIRDKYLMKNR